MTSKYMTTINNWLRWCIKNITLILKYSVLMWISTLVLTKGDDLSMMLPDAVQRFGNAIYGWIDGNVWLNATTFFIFTLIFIYIHTKIQTIRIDTNTCLWLLFGILSLNTIPVWYPLDCIIGIPYNLLITAATIFFVAEYFYHHFIKERSSSNMEEDTNHPVFSLTTDDNDLADTGWQNYANSLVSMLPSKGMKNESFAVGIYGEWGTGKTTFLQHIRKELGQRYIVIEFNPWGCLSAESVITDFFNNMKQHLCHNNELTNAIEDYMDMLTAVEVPEWLKWITGRFAGKNNNTTAFLKNNVEKLIEENGKQVAILIDDIDRLEADEVFEVMRLIRITANFHNTVFVAAYDKKHVCEMLNSKGIYSAERYIEKIFNIEVSLPCIESQTIPNIILDDLYKMTELNNSQKYEIERALWQYKNNDHRELLISSYIHNFREAKRFAALLALSLNHLKKTGLNEFYLYDLFWLELLHICCHNDYETLTTDPFSILELTRNIISKESRGATHLILKDIPNNNPILQILFNSHAGTTSNHRRVCFMNSYAKYFCYRIPSTIIPLVKFQMLMRNENTEEIINKVKEWGNCKKYRTSLIRHFAQFNIYNNTEEHVVKNYITALIAAHSYINSTEELNIYHNKFMSSCCRDDIKDFFYDTFKTAIENKPSADWNGILSSMITPQYYDAPDDIDYETYILNYEKIKSLMELNIDMYLNKYGKPNIADISDDKADFHKFLVAGSYISMYYPSNDNNEYEKTEDYSNPLCERLMALYKGDNATGFNKFIKAFIITDYDNELYEEIRITELTEKLFGSRDNFIQFIKDSFEQTDEVNSFISKYN